MEAAWFESLLTKDPEAAIARAKATESASIASERFAKIGLQLIKTNPDQAFEMMQNLFEVNPSGESPSMRVDYPKCRSTWGGGDDQSDELVSALITRDPDRVMQLVAVAGETGKREDAFHKVAWHWGNHDLAAAAEWLADSKLPYDQKAKLESTLKSISRNVDK